MITIDVDSRNIDAKLGQLPAAERSALRRAISVLTGLLRERVKGKIVGGPLHGHPGGPLQSSIQGEFRESPTSMEGRVFSRGVIYAAIHEYGGVTRPHVIRPRNARALAFIGGAGSLVFAAKVNHPGSRIPERSYARSSLADMRGQIIDALRSAVGEGLRAAE